MPAGVIVRSPPISWIGVSWPVLIPTSPATADMPEPRSNPVRLVSRIATVPVVTSASTGPFTPRSAPSVPPRRAAPLGSSTPSAGRSAMRSSAGIFSPRSVISICVDSPAGANVPASRATAPPTVTAASSSRPVRAAGSVTRVYATATGRPAGAAPFMIRNRSTWTSPWLRMVVPSCDTFPE